MSTQQNPAQTDSTTQHITPSQRAAVVIAMLGETAAKPIVELLDDEAIANNAAQAEKAKENPKLLGFFVGQVMKASGGKANPQAVQKLVREKLGVE